MVSLERLGAKELVPRESGGFLLARKAKDRAKNAQLHQHAGHQLMHDTDASRDRYCAKDELY
jgi:hypothetical protein